MDKRKLSQYLSYILRHKPEDIGITLDTNGYVKCADLIKAINDNGKYHITLNILKDIVETDNKQRYSFKDGYTYIRANQGHSTNQVDLNFKEYTNTDTLYHGTASRFIKDITNSGGLKPMSRQYVHLSKDIDTANNVGNRHGNVVILSINTKDMMKDGYKFYESENGVILTKEVPMKYIRF